MMNILESLYYTAVVAVIGWALITIALSVFGK